METELQTIGVAGLGQLGKGIAACCLAHGFRVIGYTKPDHSHEEARRYIERAIKDLVERAGFPPERIRQCEETYIPVDSLGAFATCDFVIESVVEDPGIKQAVFDEIEAVVGAEVPIGSNTSAIPITQLQAPRKHPERIVGMHWAEPAHVTRFLEIIRGEQTSDTTFERTEAMARCFGKEPALVQKDVAGFIVNRLGYVMYREAAHLVEMGVADVETIDRAFRNAFSLWSPMCGPFRWMDITGGPALYARSMDRVMPTVYADPERLPEPLEKLKQEGSEGLRNGQGFYRYEGNSTDWEDRYDEFAWRARALLNEFYPLENDDAPHH